jgi:hypothetical protein
VVAARIHSRRDRRAPWHDAGDVAFEGLAGATKSQSRHRNVWPLILGNLISYRGFKEMLFLTTDVAPILAVARHRAGGAIDPLATFRSSGYRAARTAERSSAVRLVAGIV